MSRLEAALAIIAAVGFFDGAAQASPPEPNFGAPVQPKELTRYAAAAPSGAGLPRGAGGGAMGRDIYAARCAACHGGRLEGVKETGAPPLIGGRGTLASATPLKTVESYWPFATTLFDYVRRAMPFNAPGSLTDNEVYSVSAYILASGHVIPENAVLDEATLPWVEMPNRNGFYRDPRQK